MVHYRIHCPYPKPHRSSPCPYPLLQDSLQHYPSIYAWVFQVFSFHRFPHQNPLCTRRTYTDRETNCMRTKKLHNIFMRQKLWRFIDKFYVPKINIDTQIINLQRNITTDNKIPYLYNNFIMYLKLWTIHTPPVTIIWTVLRVQVQPSESILLLGYSCSSYHT